MTEFRTPPAPEPGLPGAVRDRVREGRAEGALRVSEEPEVEIAVARTAGPLWRSMRVLAVGVLAVALLEGCGSMGTDQNYTNSCPGPLTYSGHLYGFRQASDSTPGSRLGFGRVADCASDGKSSDEHGVTVYELNGIRPKIGVVVKDAQEDTVSVYVADGVSRRRQCELGLRAC
ncbi:MAG: DUF6281 family protein [Nocardioides sp.]|uniref:DUF6281 family protein n=1 Tax=Nocardioides sp. TaxID=35761 RepID=UPI0039E2CAF7